MEVAAVVAPALDLAAGSGVVVVLQFEQRAHVAAAEVEEVPGILRGEQQRVAGRTPALDGEADAGGVGAGVLVFRRVASMGRRHVHRLLVIQPTHEDGPFLTVGKRVARVVPRHVHPLLAGVPQQLGLAAGRKIQPEQQVLIGMHVVVSV